MSNDARPQGVNVASITEFVEGYKAKEASNVRDGLKGVVRGVAIYAAVKAISSKRGR